MLSTQVKLLLELKTVVAELADGIFLLHFQLVFCKFCKHDSKFGNLLSMEKEELIGLVTLMASSLLVF